MNKPILVRLPSSHRGNDRVAHLLGYEPHEMFRWGKSGRFASLPPADAAKVLESKQATVPRSVNASDLCGVWYQADPFRHTPPKNETCEHKPERLYSWTADDDTLCVCCCECGTVLKGAA